MCLHPEFSGTHIQDMYESLISGVGPDGQLWRGPAAMAVLASFNFDVDNRGSKVQKPLMKMYEGLELAYKGLESGKLKTLKEAGFNSSGWMPAFFEPYYSKDPEIKAIERGNAGFASRGNRNAAQFRDALFLISSACRALTKRSAPTRSRHVRKKKFLRTRNVLCRALLPA